MTITFGPLATDSGTAEGGAQLALRAGGFGAGVDGAGTVLLTLTVSATGYSDAVDVTPSVPGTASVGLALLVTGTGFGRGFGEGSATVRVLPEGLGVPVDFGGGGALINLGASGFQLNTDSPYFFVTPQPPEVRGFGGSWFEAVESSLVTVDNIDQTLSLLVQAIMQLQDVPAPLMRFVSTVEDSLVARDVVSLIFLREVLDNVDLTELQPFALAQIVSVVDQLMMADETLGLINALTTVAVALVLRDTVIPVFQVDVPVDVALTEEQLFSVGALVEALSELILTPTVELSATMFALVESGMALPDFTTATIAAIVDVLDNLDFGIRIKIGDDVFAGYVVNVRNAAVSEYDNFPFNSFALVGGRPFGAAEDGIYLLEGDDDAGDPIQAYVRTGALFMDSLSHVLNAWVTLKADGELVFKTITMDKGEKKENWYRMKQRPTGEPVETRFDTAKGVVSTYWQFELENVDGAYFELNTVKIWPVRLRRRYSGR